MGILRGLSSLAFAVPCASVALGAGLQWNSSRIDWKPACLTSMPEAEFQRSEAFSPSNSFLTLFFSFYDMHWDAGRIQRQLESFGFLSVKFLSGPGLHAFVATSPELTYVHFEGTHNLRGILSDVHFGVRNAEDLGISGKVHTGFSAGFQRVRRELSGALKGTISAGVPVLISGHSYGGVMATLAGVDVVRQGGNLLAVQTSGTPRGGDSEFAREVGSVLGDKLLRLALPEDMVPHLPPRAGSGGDFARLIGFLGPLARHAEHLANKFEYSHASDVWTIQAGELARDNESDDADSRYWNSFPEPPREMVQAVTESFLSHDPGRYICRLADILLTSQGRPGGAPRD